MVQIINQLIYDDFIYFFSQSLTKYHSAHLIFFVIECLICNLYSICVYGLFPRMGVKYNFIKKKNIFFFTESNNTYI